MPIDKNFFDKMSAKDRSKLADTIEAASPEDRKQLLELLTPLVQADAEKTSLASIRAARINTVLKSDDPKDKINVKHALRQMQRLGLDIDKIAASADVKTVEEAMTKQNWSSMERMQLKTTLANLGVID